MTVQNGADKPEGAQGIPNYFNLFRPLKMRLPHCISSVVMKYYCTVLFRVFGDSKSD